MNVPPESLPPRGSSLAPAAVAPGQAPAPSAVHLTVATDSGTTAANGIAASPDRASASTIAPSSSPSPSTSPPASPSSPAPSIVGESKPDWIRNELVQPIFPEREVKPESASASQDQNGIASPTPVHPGSGAGPTGTSSPQTPGALQPPPQGSSGRSSADLVREVDMDIHMAARHGRIDRVRLLLDKKVAAVNQPDKNYGGATPLHWASLQGHERVVRLLCERGADPNGKAGNPSASPLHWAARAGQVKALKTLREFGGNPRLPDGQGYNCLHLAVQGNHPKMVQHLLSDAKMDVDGEDPMGRTPLIWACYLGSSSDVIDVLLKYKARINLPDALKFTPLHWAVGTAHYDVAKQLLLAGADREAKDRDGKTPGDRARDLGTGATYEATLRVVANRRERALSQSSASPTPAMIAAQAAKPVEAMPLRHFKLYNGVNVPCIGLGTAWSHAMDSEKVAVTLSTAIELGYRHIDSAQVYHNEKHVGDAMAAIYAKGQITREMIFHSSKAWNTHHRPQNLRAALLQTLKDLRYTYLDAYYLHWPISFLGPPDVQKDVPRGPLGEIWLDSEVNLEDTWREMEKFVDEGLVRAIGVCNFPLHQFKWLLEIARIKPAVHQFETHPYLPQPELLSYCRKHDIVVMAYAPLGITALLEDATVQQIARQYGVPPAKILVSRAIQRGTCVVLRSADARHMAENLQLIKLDQDDLETLGTLKVRKRFISPLELFGVDLFGESDKGYEDVGGAKGVALGGGGAHLVI